MWNASDFEGDIEKGKNSEGKEMFQRINDSVVPVEMMGILVEVSVGRPPLKP